MAPDARLRLMQRDWHRRFGPRRELDERDRRIRHLEREVAELRLVLAAFLEQVS